MAKQQYFCPGCRYAGEIDHRDGAGVYDVIYLIEDDHKHHSPTCNQGVRGMRVRNVEHCNEQEWAQVVAGTDLSRNERDICEERR
jgi:hypothetical protein